MRNLHFIIFFSCFDLSLSIYCKDGCYELLKLTRDASLVDIKKSYRALAKEFHPDRHKNKGDQEKYEEIFREIANAYEILKDEDSRKEYDYMLDHPEEYYRNYYNYYRRRYARKVDVRIVIIALITTISFFQYWTAWQKYNEALNYFLTIPKYRIKAKEIAERDGLLDSLSASNIKKLNKQRNMRISKEEIKSEEENILKSIIREQMDIKGSCAKPEWKDLFVCKIILSPYLLYQYVAWHVKWFYKFDYLKMEYGEEEKLYLIRKFMKMGQAQFDQFTDEEIESYIDQKLWIKSNFEEWKALKDEESKQKLLQSGRYKSYRRWVKKGGPGQISFVDED